MADDLVLDLTNYKDTVGGYVSPGRYAVVIEDAELGESSNKKTPQLTVWLRVVGGEYDGTTLVDNLYLTDKSTFRVVGFLQALNIATPRQRLTFKVRTFINRRAYVVVEDDVYNGKTRARVSAYERLTTGEGSGAPAPASGGDLDALDEFAGASGSATDLPDAEPEALPEKAAPAAPAQTVVNPEPTQLPAPTQVPSSAPAVAEDDDDSMDLDDLEM
jgi:hypothetical protein